MSITLFSVTLAGAIGAINAIDNLTTGYVSEGEQREANHADFSNAYDRISQNLDPLPPLAEQDDFGLAFVDVPGASNDCPITAVGSPTGADITFAVTSACPSKTDLQEINNLITARNQNFFVSIKGIGKICAASFPTPGNLTGSGPVTIRVADTNCLLKADNSSTAVGDTIYFPEYQLAHKLVSGKNFRSRAELASAVFYPYTRLEEKTTENCVITNNVDKSVTGFDVDGVPGTGSSDQTDAVTITISRGFIATEDRLYIDNATFTTSTNANTGDTIHTYTNVSSSNTNRFPSGITVDATYNVSQGFMRVTSSSAESVTLWEDVFKRIRYSNALTADNDNSTTYTPVDRQIIFALGRYPTRLVDGDFHFYDFVGCGSDNCITWIDAYNQASSSGQEHLGMTGYLTTVTSEEENIFVSDRARATIGGIETWAAGWLGGRDAIGTNDIPGSTSMCPSITGADRGEGKWYWVTGKPGAELCTQFWDNNTSAGRPINFDGSVATGVTPEARSDWNCSNGSAVNLTSDNRYLLESWWFSDRRGRDEYRYANWAGWSYQGTDCHSNATIGEPNDCCGGSTTIGEDVLQMTGLPSGARLWNDLHNTTVGSYQPARWYAIQGYFSEWDTSQLASDVILARDTRLNVVRHEDICKEN